jgi:hypothetical protein
MSKPYDASSKLLIDQHPRDWLALAGLPVPASEDAVNFVDAELSTITAAADKLMLVENGADSYLAHIEFQASLDLALDQRVLLYNVLGGWRHRLPVRSVVFLLWPQAASEKIRGRVGQSWAPDGRLDFYYRLIRVWELPVESLLTGPPGTLPLVPISAFPPDQRGRPRAATPRVATPGQSAARSVDRHSVAHGFAV